MRKNRANNKMNDTSRGETGMGETGTRGNKGRYFSGGTPFILICLLFLTLVGLPFSGSLLGIQDADAGDVVTNGVFNGSSPWTLLPNATTDATTTNTADGSGSILLSGSGRDTQFTGYLEQPMSLAANQTVTSAQFYTMLTTSHDRTIDDVVVQLIYSNDATTPDQACTSCITLISTGELTNSGWTPQSATNISLDPVLAVKAIRITMRAASGADKNATVDLWIDDLVIDVAIDTTQAGTAQATAIDATSLSVSMPYSFDDNGDNYCEIRYKESKDSAWILISGTLGSDCSDDGSTLTKTISTLSEAGYYDVEMTYRDPDGGEETQYAYKVLLGPSNLTTADLATIRVLAVAGGAMEILVRMPFENDDTTGGSPNSYTLEYKLSSEPSVWTPVDDSVSFPYPRESSGIFRHEITGLVRDERYDIRLTYNDTDGVAGWGSPQTYTDVLMNPTIHNSYNYSMRKWGGKWGVVGGKYGEFVCTTCHERFPQFNIKRIKDSGPITAPDPVPTDFPGAVGGSTVSFLSAVDGSSDFGDDSTAPRPNSTKICEVCHSVPEYHKYNQSSAAGHFDQADCMKCHNHATGFYPAGGQCVNCHNQAQSQLYYVRQIVESSPGAGDGDFVRLSRHVSDGTSNQIVTNYDCAICHREADADIIAAGEGWLDLYNHKNGTTATDRYVMLRNVDDINAGWKFNRNAVTEQMRTDMDSFCLACHDNNGATAISVNGTGDGLVFDGSRAMTPFNPLDNLRNGRDGLTTRAGVVDVKGQFNPGSNPWNADGSMPSAMTSSSGSVYDGLPSQHNVLGPRYSAVDSNWDSSTWTGHTTRYGQVMGNARETARLHCSDCHLNESNAHGAANAWHMLQSSTPDDFTSDVAPVADDDSYVVCYKCHSSSVYADVASTATRWSHDRDGNPWGKSYGANGAFLGPACLLCHGGDGYGHIHGRGSQSDGDGNDTFNSTYTPNGGGGTYTKQRFMPGAWMQFKPDNVNNNDLDWNTTSSGTSNCYFAPSETWSNCAHHSGAGGTSSTNYGRPIRY